MFRLVVVSAVLAVASAGLLSGHGHGLYETPVVATSYASHPVTHVEKHVIPGRTYTEVHPQVSVVEQPYVAKVGEQVHNVPTGVSYQSSSVVHSKKVVTPILSHGVQKHLVEAAPIVKTYQEPSIVKTVATQQQVAYPAHVSYAAAPVAYAAAPVHYAAQAPLVTKTLSAPVAYSGYAHAAPVAYSGYAHAAPAAYSGYAHSAPVAYSGYAHSAPVVKSVWGNTASAGYVAASPYVASPYSSHAVVASPYTSAQYGVKSALASPWSYGYGLNAAQAW